MKFMSSEVFVLMMLAGGERYANEMVKLFARRRMQTHGRYCPLRAVPPRATEARGNTLATFEERGTEGRVTLLSLDWPRTNRTPTLPRALRWFPSQPFYPRRATQAGLRPLTQAPRRWTWRRMRQL